MSRFKSVDVEDIIARKSLRDSDVARLRAAFYDEGDISPDEAGLLFRLNDVCNVTDEAWADFFVEAVTDYVVRQAQPEGYVTTEKAEWLISAIGHDGIVQSKTELEALVTILETSRWSPPSLAAYAMDQVRAAVVEGRGTLRNGSELQPGIIAEAEVELLRRIIYAFGGDGGVAVTRSEAEKLFEIDAAVSAIGSSPAWSDLFVKAIANVVMGASGYKVPSREEAMRAEVWLDSRNDMSLAGMASSVAEEGLSGIVSAYFGQSSEERAIARLERQRLAIVTGEELSDDEVEWLCAQLGRDGELSPNEKALVRFLGKNAPSLDPRLEEMVAKFASAA